MIILKNGFYYSNVVSSTCYKFIKLAKMVTLSEVTGHSGRPMGPDGTPLVIKGMVVVAATACAPFTIGMLLHAIFRRR
jgi:hypothetical protein